MRFLMLKNSLINAQLGQTYNLAFSTEANICVDKNERGQEKN
jgi:hypothetical protein